MEFEKMVRIKMIEKNLKVKDLALKLGCSSANLSQLLTNGNLRESSMRKIAEALDCDFDFVLTDKL